ncbi:MAG: cytochrome b/b6 domain-containing protein [Proteobacteria bacterium]|nr:cytochrome b/b6 domain-containing protein [Pseudomonadota bacterium]MBU1965067.1 cytochrome b/b6 domain-containing protein [Pseudomonadota bacterium]
MKKVFLHTLTIRIWHWINALIVIVLLITGIQLRAPEIEEFARGMALWVPEYSMAVLIHKYVGYAMTLSFLFWLVYIMASGSFRTHYILRPSDLPILGKQAFYYIIGVFQGSDNPFTPTEKGKFNPLQKIAYGSVMLVITPLVVVTGVLFSDIFLFRGVIDWLGGVRLLDALHVLGSYLFLLNLIVHLYMCTMGHHIFDHIKAMILGYEEMPEESPSKH